MAGYLTAIRRLVGEAGRYRAEWIRSAGPILNASGDEMGDLASTAILVGRRGLDEFTNARRQVMELPVPTSCQTAQIAIMAWFEKNIAACETMVEAGESNDTHRFKTAFHLLAESRYDLRAFQTETTALIEKLRERLRRRTRPRREQREGKATPLGWLFGKAPTA
jgi:hypothetical protein